MNDTQTEETADAKDTPPAFDPAKIPDWIRTLAVLRRTSMRWPAMQTLKELASDGQATGKQEAENTDVFLWEITKHGLKSLATWEHFNGPAEDRTRWKPRGGHGIADAVSWASTVLTFENNTPEERAALETICNTCDQVKTDKDGNWCGACGCGVSSRDKQIFNLAHYREPLNDRGYPAVRLCKHPKRDHGKGWPIVALTVKGADRVA